MYVTGGQYKGYKVEVPKNVKPTLSKVRQGVFNMLNQFEFKDNTFLDMFSGSGLMGLEAFSRGYTPVMLEVNPKNASIIKNNCKKTGKELEVVIVDSLKYKTHKKYDIIYIDPPWDKDYASIIAKAAELKSKNGIIAVEYDGEKNINIDNIIDNKYIFLSILKTKKYGRCRVTLLY